MVSKKNSGFLIRQRAFLKLYMITLTEKEKLYGFESLGYLHDEFELLGYEPTHTEVYKSLHDLEADGILKREMKLKEGMERQRVVYYRFADYEKAMLYKKQLKVELDRCEKLIKKAIKDNFK